MNTLRRNKLCRIIEKLQRLEALRLEIKDELESVLEEEQECLDNMPESLQESERGQQMQEYIEAMDGALDALDEYDHDSIYDPLLRSHEKQNTLTPQFRREGIFCYTRIAGQKCRKKQRFPPAEFV